MAGQYNDFEGGSRSFIPHGQVLQMQDEAADIEFLPYNSLQFEETTLSGRIKSFRYQTDTTSRMFGKLLKIDPSVSKWVGR